MREIKFRAWSEEFGMMFYPNVGEEQFEDLVGEKGSPKCGLMQPQGSLSYMHSQRSPIMQYTGLKDKNGKEIFEGDICKTRDGHCEVVMGHHNGAWCFSFPKVGTGIRTPILNYIEGTMGCAPENKFEVIGNAYEGIFNEVNK